MYSFDRDGGLFARVKIERANNTLRQAESIIRFAAERKIVKHSSLHGSRGSHARVYICRSTRIYDREFSFVADPEDYSYYYSSRFISPFFLSI